MLIFFEFLFELKPQLIFFWKIKSSNFFQTYKYMLQLSFWIKLVIYNSSVWIEFAFRHWKKSILVIHQLFRASNVIVHKFVGHPVYHIYICNQQIFVGLLLMLNKIVFKFLKIRLVCPILFKSNLIHRFPRVLWRLMADQKVD